MGISSRYILSQGPAITALGRTALRAAQQSLMERRGQAPGTTVAPGRAVHMRCKPVPRDLIAAYVRQVGGDPKAYGKEVPPHLFPQWCLPALAQALEQTHYPLLRIVNAGCRVQVQGPLPTGEPLVVRAQLQDIDDDGRRAILHLRVTTGADAAPEALLIDFYTRVPIPKPRAAKAAGTPASNGGTRPAASGSNGGGNKPPAAKPASARERPRVPEGARELTRIRLGRDAGLGFAKLTGDFNPIHWVPAYARASGFPNVILHGFGTLAYAWEGLARRLFGGDVHALSQVDVKFTRPLVLPHEVGLYVTDRELFVGDAQGGPAYLTGTYMMRGDLWPT